MTQIFEISWTSYEKILTAILPDNERHEITGLSMLKIL